MLPEPKSIVVFFLKKSGVINYCAKLIITYVFELICSSNIFVSLNETK